MYAQDTCERWVKAKILLLSTFVGIVSVILTLNLSQSAGKHVAAAVA